MQYCKAYYIHVHCVHITGCIIEKEHTGEKIERKKANMQQYVAIPFVLKVEMKCSCIIQYDGLSSAHLLHLLHQHMTSFNSCIPWVLILQC